MPPSARRDPFQPFELLIAEFGETGGSEARFEIEDIDQGRVHPADVEGVPALPASRAIAFEVRLAIVGVGDIMLAGVDIDLCFSAFIAWSASSNSLSFDKWVMSPV
jgi:hypothetical protein